MASQDKHVSKIGALAALLPGRRPALFLAMTIVAALLATGAFRKLYYDIFPWVLSFNLVFPQEAYTTPIGGWVSERDGIEIYVVYAFSLAAMGLAGLVIWLASLLRGRWQHLAMGLAFLAAALFAAYLFRDIRFYPPLEGPPRRWYVLGFALFLVAIAFYRGAIPLRWEALVAALILVPSCFISTSEIAIGNYVYVLDPAQKLLEGVPIQQIYFQYEFLIASMAALWMRLGLSETSLQILGQLSNFLVLLTLFLLARRLFIRETLAWYMLLALIVFRIFGAPWDPVLLLQTTPLRLELWLIPFLLIYWRGPYDWTVPFVCGLLILVHGPLGLVYTLGYVQLIATLVVLTVADAGWRARLTAILRPAVAVPIAIAALYLLGCLLMSRAVFAQNIVATGYYQKIGIGFLPLGKTSVFWMLPIVMACTFVVLVALRRHVSQRYLALGLALIFFCVGNSIYFLGRSHELNIFSVSISAIFLLFYMLDAFVRYHASSGPQASGGRPGNLATLAGGALLVAMAYGCGAQIEFNLKAKFDRVASMNFYPATRLDAAAATVSRIEAELHGRLPEAANVQFLTYDEIEEYVFYRGDRTDQSFFYPLEASIFVDDLAAQARTLLDKGAYLLVDPVVVSDLERGGFSPADYGYRSELGQLILIGKDSPPRP